MKKIMNWLIVLVAVTWSFVATSAQFVISNDDDVVSAPTYGPMAARGITQVTPKLGEDGVIITSLAASTSPNLLQSRNYAMAGMFNVNVPQDRNVDPAAWYWVPSPNMQPLGLQWFDMITSTYSSYRGSTTFTNAATAGEKGHRIVVHVTGGYPVSAYTLTVSSSLTNIPTSTFAIGTNTTTGLEIPFNQNFPAGNNGPNGTNESTWSTVMSQLVPMGDDTGYQAGQLPSTNIYHWFVRFGSTISIVVSSPAEMENIRQQFAQGKQWLMVELKKNGVLVAMSHVESAMPHVQIFPIDEEKNSVGFMIHGGQENSPYSLESCLDLRTLDWQPFFSGNFLFSGAQNNSYPVEKPTHERFFRAKAN